MMGLFNFIKMFFVSAIYPNEPAGYTKIAESNVSNAPEGYNIPILSPSTIPAAIPTSTEKLISIPTNSVNTLKKFMSIDENRLLVNKFILSELTRSIKNNKSRTELFQIGETPIVARIDKKDYEKTLAEIENFFVNHQNDKYAKQCQKLITKHRVNMFLE